MKWLNLSNTPLSPRELQELYVMLIVVFVGALLFLRPKKSDYKNYFIAWILFLALVALVMGTIWFLFYFRIIPYSFGAGFLDQGYWMILVAIAAVAILNSFDALAKRFKIKK